MQNTGGYPISKNTTIWLKCKAKEYNGAFIKTRKFNYII